MIKALEFFGENMFRIGAVMWLLNYLRIYLQYKKLIDLEIGWLGVLIAAATLIGMINGGIQGIRRDGVFLLALVAGSALMVVIGNGKFL